MIGRQPLDLGEGVDDDPADAELAPPARARPRSCCCRGSRSAPDRSRPARRRSAHRPSRRRGRAPPRRPSGRSSCRGTPCPRSRRRTPRTRRGTPGPGPGSRASSRTYAGEPCSATRSARATPPTVSRPSTFWAVVDQRCRTSCVGVGRLAQPGRPLEGARCVRPAGFVGHAVTSARARRRRAGRGRWRRPCASPRRARGGPG